MTVAFQNSSFINGGATAATGTYSNGVSYASFYNTDALDNKFNYNDTKEGYEMAVAGRDSAIQEQIESLSYYIENGEEDKVLDAYHGLLDEMSAQGRYAKLITADGDDKQLRAVAKGMIESQIGCKLSDYIENNTSSHKNTVYKNILFWGRADNTSSEDLLEEMCNIKKEKKAANIIVGAAAAVASVVAAPINILFGNSKH